MDNITSLHVHYAPGSIGDSILKIPQCIERVKKYGMKAIAITDHGNMGAVYRFYNECIENDIKPIIGCEVYVTLDKTDKDKTSESAKQRSHLVLLAKNEQGLENLIRIVNDASIDGFYYRPRTDFETLQEYGEGIIGLSACLGGDIPKAILNDDEELAVKLIEYFKNCFDAFYLEIQPSKQDNQIKVNNALVRLAEETDTPLVMTNDVHYLNSDDYLIHNLHVAIGRGQVATDELLYGDNCYWLMDRENAFNAFVRTEWVTDEVVNQAMDNTNVIADMCNAKLSTEVHMPAFINGDVKEEDYQLTKKCFQKLKEIELVIADPANYMERLLYELDVIRQLGFSGYFLMVEDFIHHAKSIGIAVGPGRGSVGGSLVAHLLGISLADPIKYDLLFERFLSPHRKSMPDIDVDYDSERRGEMFDYAAGRYGYQNCALVSTFQMRKAKASIRDTARVLDIDLDIADKAAKLIPQVFYDDDGEKTTDLSIAESIEVVPELAEMAAEYPEWFEMAQRLEGVPANKSLHAAGILVSPIPLDTKIPLIQSNREGILATALNLGDAECAGFVKFDFLSLATLSVIDKTMADVGIEFDYRNNRFDDEAVWNMIGSKHTTGLFQISSRTYKSRMPRLKPTSIQELAACLALVRGPCISSGADKVYMEICEGKREIELIHPLYDDITHDTKGIVLYQEQIMQLAVAVGFSIETGYDIMKAIAKKKLAKIQTYEAEFKEKAAEKGVPSGAIDHIWQIIYDAGLYSFNSGHATSYALLCYASAYLKAHHPKEFMCNLITNSYKKKNKKDKEAEINEILDDCRRFGIQFLPLDVNKSSWDFVLEEEGIRIGFCAVKGFGEKAADAVITKRPYTSVEDFLEKVEKKTCNKKSVIAGLFSGMFDCFDPDRCGTYYRFMELRKEEPLEKIVLQSKEEFKVTDDIDVFEGIFLGGQFLSDPTNGLDRIGFDEIKNNGQFEATVYIKDIKKIKDKMKQQMAFMTLATGDGMFECVVWADKYKEFKSKLKKHTLLSLKAKKKSEESCELLMAG